MKSSREPPGLTQELNNKPERLADTENECDLFKDLKHRFLSFKKHKYMKNLEQYQKLAEGQAPKFMVIACADSRVCPSAILGFQPGEAFTIRNVANLVPLFERGPSETNAALEFAVNSLEVENILVIGHSCCGGIRALMSMEEGEDSSSFIKNWVVVGKNARLITKAVASNLSFDQQCRHCEKESLNRSLLNLLSYPWIEEKVRKGVLSIHGGYYDFVDCTFEKWTLDYKESNSKEESGEFSVKDRLFWC
jgi:carbonic anhydrase